MAFPTFFGAGTLTTGTAAITPPFPAGTLANDVACLVVQSENQAITLSAAQGFVEVLNSPQSAGTAGANPACRIAVFWKRLVGGDTAPTVADPGDHAVGRMFVFRGCRTVGNPWSVTAGGNDGGANDTTGVVPGALSPAIDCLVWLICGTSFNSTSSAQFSGWTNADLANLVEISDDCHTVGLGGGFGTATGEKATTGTYAATTVTLANTSFKGALSIALEPPSTNSIAHDATVSAAAAVASSLTYAHTVSGSDRLLVVGVGTNSSTLSSITYAGPTLTAVAETDAEGGIRGYMQRLVAPTTGANNVVVTFVDLSNITSTASSYTGVDQTTPVDTPATAVSTAGSTAPSVVVTSATDDLVIDAVHDDGVGTITVDAGQTERGNHRGAGNGAGQAMSTEAGAAWVTMSWTKSVSNKWGIIGVSMNPAAAGGAGRPLRRMMPLLGVA